MHCRASNIHLSTRKIKLHANQQNILLLEKWLNVVSPHFTTWVYNLSNIIQRFIQNLWSSCLSTRSKWRTTTLSSQYKVSSIQNLRPSRLNTRLKWRKTTLLSQYKVKMKKNDPLISVQGQFKSKIYNPLVSVQGQFKVRDPLVSLQGLGLYLYIYFIVFYFH